MPGAAERRGFDKTPAEWLPLLRRFAELCQPLAKSDRYTVRRIKQWLGLANHDGRMPWFDALKRRESLEELLGDLRALVEVDVTGERSSASQAACGVSDRSSLCGLTCAIREMGLRRARQ